MGFFDKIFIQKGEGIPVDITDLNQEQYESFLEMTMQLNVAYKLAIAAKKRKDEG